tara:strand:- start:3370 stop:4155 length:786 start_codon:yes stop_codon:yes gene_type:complete
MRILSWNVAGLRAMLKKEPFMQFISENNLEIICLQETKAEENQVMLPKELLSMYPYRFWNSTDGKTQRKGLSGTTIWCRSQPIKVFENADFDNEGRIVTIEFENFILVNVYVPNSQKFENDRYRFREEWNTKFCAYLKKINEIKPIIVCGDMNVAHHDIDISNPSSKKNKVPGFFDNERLDFSYLLEMNSLVDVYRTLYPLKRKSTYWSNFLKSPRSKENGWRIDYFLVSENLYKENLIKNCFISMETMGSDHCPVCLDLN